MQRKLDASDRPAVQVKRGDVDAAKRKEAAEKLEKIRQFNLKERERAKQVWRDLENKRKQEALLEQQKKEELVEKAKSALDERKKDREERKALFQEAVRQKRTERKSPSRSDGDSSPTPGALAADDGVVVLTPQRPREKAVEPTVAAVEQPLGTSSAAAPPKPAVPMRLIRRNLQETVPNGRLLSEDPPESDRRSKAGGSATSALLPTLDLRKVAATESPHATLPYLPLGGAETAAVPATERLFKSRFTVRQSTPPAGAANGSSGRVAAGPPAVKYYSPLVDSLVSAHMLPDANKRDTHPAVLAPLYHSERQQQRPKERPGSSAVMRPSLAHSATAGGAVRLPSMGDSAPRVVDQHQQLQHQHQQQPQPAFTQGTLDHSSSSALLPPLQHSSSSSSMPHHPPDAVLPPAPVPWSTYGFPPNGGPSAPGPVGQQQHSYSMSAIGYPPLPPNAANFPFGALAPPLSHEHLAQLPASAWPAYFGLPPQFYAGAAWPMMPSAAVSGAGALGLPHQSHAPVAAVHSVAPPVNAKQTKTKATKRAPREPDPAIAGQLPAQQQQQQQQQQPRQARSTRTMDADVSRAMAGPADAGVAHANAFAERPGTAEVLLTQKAKRKAGNQRQGEHRGADVPEEMRRSLEEARVYQSLHRLERKMIEQKRELELLTATARSALTGESSEPVDVSSGAATARTNGARKGRAGVPFKPPAAQPVVPVRQRNRSKRADVVDRAGGMKPPDATDINGEPAMGTRRMRKQWDKTVAVVPAVLDTPFSAPAPVSLPSARWTDDVIDFTPFRDPSLESPLRQAAVSVELPSPPSVAAAAVAATGVDSRPLSDRPSSGSSRPDSAPRGQIPTKPKSEGVIYQSELARKLLFS